MTMTPKEREEAADELEAIANGPTICHGGEVFLRVVKPSRLLEAAAHLREPVGVPVEVVRRYLEALKLGGSTQDWAEFEAALAALRQAMGEG